MLLRRLVVPVTTSCTCGALDWVGHSGDGSAAGRGEGRGDSGRRSRWGHLREGGALPPWLGEEDERRRCAVGRGLRLRYNGAMDFRRSGRAVASRVGTGATQVVGLVGLTGWAGCLLV